MKTVPSKVPILAQSDDSRTAHLQPLIDFLKAQGNESASPAGFTYDRDGYGSYYFAQPLDIEALRAQFDFPPSIEAGPLAVFDSGNFVAITQALPPGRVLSFEV